MLYGMKIFHVRLHKTLKYTWLPTKFQYFDMEICCHVCRLTEKHLCVTSLTSSFHVSDMKLCSIINANLPRALTYLAFRSIESSPLNTIFFFADYVRKCCCYSPQYKMSKIYATSTKFSFIN
jgi:hypothetical protein